MLTKLIEELAAPAPKITPPMRKLLLWCARTRKPAAHSPGRTAGGGSVMRMIRRMVAMGLLEKKPPFAITRKGRLAGTGSSKP